MEPFATGVVLAAVGALLIVAAVVSPVSQRLGLPALVGLLVLGMLAGSEGVGGIPFADYALAFRLGTIALVLILFDGGLGTPVETFRRVAVPAALLATVGVAVTAYVVAGVAWLLGLPLPLALLVGAVVSSTDAAAVFSVLRGSGVRLKETTGATLEVESGLNDPAAVALTVMATELVLGTETAGPRLVLVAGVELGIGVAGGLAAGYAGRALLRVAGLPAAGLYPVLTLAIACTAFGVTTVLHGSGFLAVYLAGVVLASGPLPYRAGIRRVHDALAWLAQLLMFLLLGLLVFPSRLVPLAGRGLLLGAALALVARPVAVLVALLPVTAPWRERLFVAWVGLRGAVPIVLATYPVLRHVPAADELFHLVFFVVLVNSIVPGATVAWLARRWGLATREPVAPPASVELVSLRDYPGDFVWYRVHRASAAAGALVGELPLPGGCVLTLLLRADAVVAPTADVRLAEGDLVCVFAVRAERSFVDLVFGREEDVG